MMKQTLALFALMANGITSSQAVGQPASGPTEAVRTQVIALTVALFPGASLDDEPVQHPDDPPANLERRALERGVLSGLLELCGAEWAQTSFFPFMQSVRALGTLNDRQIAGVPYLHGFAQGRTVQSQASNNAELCTYERIEAYRQIAAMTGL